MSEILEFCIPDHAHIKCVVVDSVRPSFIVQDVRNFTEHKIIEILSLKSSIKGSGKELLLAFCSLFEEYPIVIKAEPMYETEELYFSSKEFGEFDISVKKLSEYYISCGFMDINDYVGYTSGRAFIYGNKIGKLIVEKMRDAYES